MSSATIIAAVLQILQTDVGSDFPQIADIDAVQLVRGKPAILPADSPALIVAVTQAPEQSGTFGRSKVEQDLDIHCWSVTDVVPNNDDAQAWKTLVGNVMIRLRLHPRLDDLANVPGTSAVLIASRRLKLQHSRPIVTKGQVWYHAVITDRIQEWVQSPIT